MFNNNPVANIIVGSVMTIAGVVLGNLGAQTLGTGVAQAIGNAFNITQEDILKLDVVESNEN